MNYQELITKITKSILDNITPYLQDTLKRDKTFKAKVTEIIKDGKVKILYSGKIHTASTTLPCELNDMVRVCVPSGNWQDMYIVENRSKGRTIRDVFNKCSLLDKILANINSEIEEINSEIEEVNSEIEVINQKVLGLENGVAEFDSKLVYPVGSICVTNTNSDPSEIYGGTWELFDKEYKCQNITATKTLTNASAASVYAYLSGHIIDLKINITPSVDITDTSVNMITIDPASCGATQFGEATRWYTSFSDVSNVVICYALTTAGVISIRDIMVRGSDTANLTVPSDTLTNFQVIVSQNSISYMLDSFCDKFYWKRTS